MRERHIKFYERIEEMTEAERADLDPICYALDAYMAKTCGDEGYIVPNRAAALAAIMAVKGFNDDHESAWETLQ